MCYIWVYLLNCIIIYIIIAEEEETAIIYSLLPCLGGAPLPKPQMPVLSVLREDVFRGRVSLLSWFNQLYCHPDILGIYYDKASAREEKIKD